MYEEKTKIDTEKSQQSRLCRLRSLRWIVLSSILSFSVKSQFPRDTRRKDITHSRICSFRSKLFNFLWIVVASLSFSMN
ncbi:hypothetical protein PUN28_019902 [Cardiocondyla obscurior]|uniref:Uncharacterized protein n=1 Tax=Cardiocondyla obscurior TaxID=286306 RepID=A0AAW2EDT6_9HYME